MPTKIGDSAEQHLDFAGRLDFALLASVGRAYRAFTNAVFDVVEGTAEQHPPAVY